MPLFKQWNIGAQGRAAIWKVEEPESFFREYTGMESSIKNDKRRMEHLAGRFLLKYLQPDFPLDEIRKDEHHKPRIDDNRYYFSISHSWPYIAVVIDPHHEAGIDIQTWNHRIGDIQRKFLSPEEQEIFRNDVKLMTMAWTAKEAAYKWNGKRDVEFIADLPINFFEPDPQVNNISILFKLTETPKMIFIENIINIDFACSYVNSVEEWVIY